MNLIFNADNRNAHAELKRRLDDQKLKYKVIDDDGCRVGFKVTKDKADDFQMNLANTVMGNSIPGMFFVEEWKIIVDNPKIKCYIKYDLYIDRSFLKMRYLWFYLL